MLCIRPILKLLTQLLPKFYSTQSNYQYEYLVTEGLWLEPNPPLLTTTLLHTCISLLHTSLLIFSVFRIFPTIQNFQLLSMVCLYFETANLYKRISLCLDNNVDCNARVSTILQAEPIPKVLKPFTEKKR